jgi:hypothetical protein
MRPIFNIVFSFTCFFLVCGQALAQDTIQLFTKDLLRENNPDRDFAGSGATGQPSGGYIYRFYFDVTGDGIPEIFVASSLDVINDDIPWSVYQQDKAGHARLLAKGVDLYPSFYVNKKSGKIIISQLSSARHEPDHVSYNIFDALGTYLRKEKIVTDSETPRGLTEAGYINFLGLGRQASPKIEKILLGQYLANPASSWRPYDKNNDATHQHLDKADAVSIEANKHFIFSKAKEL